MKVQVFRGRTLTEARRAAEDALGSGTVILTSRTVRRPGVAGWFAGSDVEVSAIAASEERAVDPVPVSKPTCFAPGAYTASSPNGAVPEIHALRTELKGDIRAIKTMLSNADGASALVEEIANLRSLVEGVALAEPERAHLRAMGVEGPAAGALAQALNGKALEPEVVREVISRVLTAAPWPVESERVMIALVGSAGVGKTTTAAKLAACARAQGRSVTLVGCDAYRVGATEQLARYGHLMGAEVVAARGPEELRAILDEARSDVVIVDTSGRPSTPGGPESALATTRRTGRETRRARHVLLCMPAAVRATDAARIAKTYGVLGPTSLAVTKLDETDVPAGVIHASWATRLPFSVLCFGQRVPEDVAPATVGALLEYLVPHAGRKAAAA